MRKSCEEIKPYNGDSIQLKSSKINAKYRLIKDAEKRQENKI